MHSASSVEPTSGYFVTFLAPVGLFENHLVILRVIHKLTPPFLCSRPISHIHENGEGKSFAKRRLIQAEAYADSPWKGFEDAHVWVSVTSQHRETSVMHVILRWLGVLSQPQNF